MSVDPLGPRAWLYSQILDRMQNVRLTILVNLQDGKQPTPAVLKGLAEDLDTASDDLRALFEGENQREDAI